MPPPAVQPIRPDVETKDRQAKIDEFGDLDLKFQHLAGDLARHKLLKEEITGWSKEEDGAKPCTFTGGRWAVLFLPRENRRTVFDPRKAFTLLKKIIGIDATMALVDVPLGAAVDKFIPEGQHKLFLKQERTGPRTMKVMPTAPPPQAA